MNFRFTSVIVSPLMATNSRNFERDLLKNENLKQKK